MSDIRTDRYTLLLGDCLERLKELPDNSVDALVTDPPAGISFMGKSWDDDKGGSKQWINWLSSVLVEVNRVLKPGAHGFVWALPRTSHWTAMAIEWADLEIRDCVTHLFGSGFPKSMDVSKAIDKSLGAAHKRKLIGFKHQGTKSMFDGGKPRPATLPATEWDGWGTALKPAAEFWWLIRKPLSEKTVAANVLKWGTGAINIEASRVGGVGKVIAQGESQGGWGSEKSGGLRKPIFDDTQRGRFPANLVLSHYEGCVQISSGSRGGSETAGFQDEYVGGKVKRGVQRMGYESEEPEKWDCAEDCPVRLLDAQSGVSNSTGGKNGGKLGGHVYGEFQNMKRANAGGLGDTGGASRFFLVLPPNRDIESECNHTFAPRVSSVFKTILAIDESSALKNATRSLNEQLAQNVGSAETLCEICATSIARDLVEIKNLVSNPEKLRLILESTQRFEGFFLSQCLALVDQWESTGITPTIQSLSKLFGCAPLATGESIKPESQNEDLDQGAATRFLYTPKPGNRERSAGLGDLPEGLARSNMVSCNGHGDQRLDGKPIPTRRNTHPTVKPFALMRYLIRMITPPGGTVLDCFLGSGTTGAVAVACGFKFVGVEREPEYLRIAAGRIADVRLQPEPAPTDQPLDTEPTA